MKKALIIVDMQKDFVLPGRPACVAGAFNTIPFIKKILNFFREKKYPIFHVIREYRKDGSDIEIVRLKNFLKGPKYCVKNSEGAEIVDELKPENNLNEYVIVKNRFSAFMNTELDFMLRRLQIETIVVCGTQYPNCIRCTVFDGISFGYNVELLTDATSAQTEEIAKANIIDIKNIGINCLTVDEFIKKN